MKRIKSEADDMLVDASEDEKDDEKLQKQCTICREIKNPEKTVRLCLRGHTICIQCH